MKLGAFAVLALAASSLFAAPAALAQTGAISPPGDGPLDISADDLDVFDRENRIVYSGDVNAVRGDTRLRADRIEVFFEPAAGAGFGSVTRMHATGEVFYVTPTEVIRADRGVYDFSEGQIVLTGGVVLTQGCNVSTGERLTANLDTGVSQLAGSEEEGQRVRSVFFPERDGEAPAVAVEDCPSPAIPGEGPQPFQEG